jgi:hypothetical protein
MILFYVHWEIRGNYLRIYPGMRQNHVAQAQQVGDKSSEIPVVRGLLKDTGLDAKKVSLDAHHSLKIRETER